MAEQPSKFICEICGGAHPTSEHPPAGGEETPELVSPVEQAPAQEAVRPEARKVFTERLFDHKKKRRQALQFMPRDRHSTLEYEKQLQELVENEARVVGVSWIQSDYMRKKVRGKYFDTVNKKEQEVLSPVGLRMAMGESVISVWTGDTESYDFLEYQGKRISNPHKFLADADPNFLALELKAEGFFAKDRRESAAKFQAAFSALPEDVRKAATEWARWYRDADGAGFTLDLMLNSGLIKQDKYDEIQRARKEGKKILWSGREGLKPTIISREQQMFYWAIVDDPKKLSEFKKSIFGREKWSGDEYEKSEHIAARNIIPLLDRASTPEELEAIFDSILTKLEEGTSPVGRAREFAKNRFIKTLLKEKWLPGKE